MKKMKWLLEEESGQGMAEYALILAVVSVAAIAIIQLVGTGLSVRYGDIVNRLNS